MTTAYSLDDFNTEFSDDDYTTTRRSAFEFEKCYHLQITGQAVKVKDSGFVQLELTVSKILGNGDTYKAGCIWQTLPIFTREKEQDLGAEKTKFMRELFRNQLLSLLRATHHDGTYDLYASVERRGGKKVYLDSEGNTLTNAQLNERKTELNRQTLAIAKALVAGSHEDLFIDKDFYYVEVPAKKADQIYKNYYPQPADKYPLVEE